MRRVFAVLAVPASLLGFLVAGGPVDLVPAANTIVGPGSFDEFVSPSTFRCPKVPGASEGDVAIVNITNTNATGGGWGALRAASAAPVFNRPASQQYSSVNFAANTPPNPNLAVTPVGPGNQFCYDGALSAHNVILDLSAVIPAANVNATDPERLLDTRAQGGVVSPSTSRCVNVPGASDGDVAVVNITNTNAAGGGWGALRASDATPVFDRPVADQYSSVNFATNTPPNPNLAVTPVGPDNQFCYDGALSAHNVILDLSAVIPAANVNATDPERLLDTRTELPPINPTTTTTVFVPPPTSPRPTVPPPTAPPPNCHSSYPTVCIPPPPPDLNCPDIPFRNFTVLPPDPHGFDRNKDGVGCET